MTVLKTVLKIICVSGAVVSLLYALYALLFKKSREDVSLDSAIRNMTAKRRNVKESSRVLKPDPAMRSATDGDNAVSGEEGTESEIMAPAVSAADGEKQEGDRVQPSDRELLNRAEEEAAVQTDMPEMQQEQQENQEDEPAQFFHGLDEDIQSDYHERQSLDSESAEEDVSDRVEGTSDEDAAYRGAETSDAAFYGGGNISPGQETGPGNAQETGDQGGNTEFEEITDTDTSSETFSPEPAPGEDEPGEEEEEREGDGTLFS